MCSVVHSLINASLQYTSGGYQWHMAVRWMRTHYCSHRAHSLIHKVLHFFHFFLPLQPLLRQSRRYFLRFSLCLSFSLIFFPQTQSRGNSICRFPSRHQWWVQGPTTCHLSFFIALPSLLLLMQRSRRGRNGAVGGRCQRLTGGNH